MKPDEARARRKLTMAAEAARGERLERFLREGGDREVVRPELIPTHEDLVEADRGLRAGLAAAGRRERGRRRADLLDHKVIPALARVIYLERVMALDPLARAGLRPTQLVALSSVSRADLQTKLGEIRRAGG